MEPPPLIAIRRSGDRIECRGGPWDGRWVEDQGWMFTVVAELDPDDDSEHPVIRPGHTSGVYVRQRGPGGVEYAWRPDAAP